MAGRKSAMQYMARRDYTSSELRSKLRQHGYDANTAAVVVAELEEENILNERRYVEHFISYQMGRGQGPGRIAARLRSLGVKSELISEMFAEGQDWVAHAREVRRKKYGDVLPWVHGDKQRQSRFLQQRGFTTSQIRQALSGEDN